MVESWSDVLDHLQVSRQIVTVWFAFVQMERCGLILETTVAKLLINRVGKRVWKMLTNGLIVPHMFHVTPIWQSV